MKHSNRKHHLRKKELRRFLDNGIISVGEDICYHDAEGLPDKSDGRYYICGLWFQGYKYCPQPTSACCFLTYWNYKHSNFTVHMSKLKCPHSRQKVRSNFLTPRMLYKLNADYETKW